MATVANKTVGIVAPSGFVADGAALDRAAQFFTACGWRVSAGESCFAREQRFAGDDALRASELQRFVTDRSLDLVLAARGGYGLMRIIDRLDFAKVRAAGRVIVGYSDFTAFNLALLARAGGVSWQGPSAMDFGAAVPEPFTHDNFFAAIDSDQFSIEFESDGPACDVRGTLWGGNLALTCALLGTPFFPRVRGGILFLEDVNEAAYQIERMLLPLLHAGVLQQQKLIVLGAFSPVPPQANDNGYSLAAAIAHLRARCATPIATGLPFGHVPRKLTLPVGARARCTIAGGCATIVCRGYPRLRG